MSGSCLYFNMSSLNFNFLNEVTKKIRKGRHKKIFCGLSNILKNIS